MPKGEPAELSTIRPVRVRVRDELSTKRRGNELSTIRPPSTRPRLRGRGEVLKYGFGTTRRDVSPPASVPVFAAGPRLTGSGTTDSRAVGGGTGYGPRLRK